MRFSRTRWIRPVSFSSSRSLSAVIVISIACWSLLSRIAVNIFLRFSHRVLKWNSSSRGTKGSFRMAFMTLWIFVTRRVCTERSV